MKRFWGFVKASRSQPENLSFNINNNQCTDPVQIAKGFNDLFSSFFTQTDDSVEITSPTLEIQNKNTMSFGYNQVLSRIKKLAADKAVGPDNISARMLKLCAPNIAPVIARIFNISIAAGKLPMGWKIANIVLEYKRVIVQR